MKFKLKKKIKNIFSWLLIATYLLISLSFAKSEKSKIRCNDIIVKITDTTGNYFIESKDITGILKKENSEILGYPIDKINTLEIENKIKKYSAVKDANAFCNIRGKFSIFVEQRQPILRVINYNGESYYIDEEGAMMQLSNKYTAKVLVANGNINEPFESRYYINVEKAEEDEFGRGKILSDLYKLALFIDKDDFWKAEIAQIYVNEDNEIELIPVVGIHRILLGSVENYKIKLRNLKAFYKRGITKKGWNKYSLINLKFENQIVCQKKY